VTDIEIESDDVPARQTIEAIDDVKETLMPTLPAETIETENGRIDTRGATDGEVNANGIAIEVPPVETLVATMTTVGETETPTKIVDEEVETDEMMAADLANNTKTVAALLLLLRSESRPLT
jgi:hypothetical protein